MTSRIGKLALGGVATTMGVGLAYYLFLTNKKWSTTVHAKSKPCRAKGPLPTRKALIESLQNDSFDVLIIGGGATGVGCALDAVTRGLKTALVEADDFGSGTSSRSTKLVHGGVRYLQKAIMTFDMVQFNMVRESLNERAGLLETARHLVQPLPIMLPVYTWWQLPYFWVGIKMYDLIAGSKKIKDSYILSKQSALDLFPILKSDKLCGAIVYYDGLMDDARLNLAIALTAIRYGATVANHVVVTGLIKEESDKGEVITAVDVEDKLTGEKWSIAAKCVINATGPFTDSIRKMDDFSSKKICAPSSGVHIMLPGFYSPEAMGLLDPDTSDGRVIFFIPWLKHTIVGTTDLPCDVTFRPKPSEEEIVFILDEIKNYLNKDAIQLQRNDVMAAWNGIRPLVSDPNKPNTESLARNHIIHVSESGLVTIAGGKWTTYRSMAEQTIDAAVASCHLRPRFMKCRTEGILLDGAHTWTPTMFIQMVQTCGLESEVAMHLATTYGDKALDVAELAAPTGHRWPFKGKKIHPNFPFIEAEVRYSAREEYALTAVDMIARRIRLAFLNVEAAKEALPKIVNVMAEELRWSASEKKEQEQDAMQFLQEQMGGNMVKRHEMNLEGKELNYYTKKFQDMDKDNKGYVAIDDVDKSLQQQGDINISSVRIHEVLYEINTGVHGQFNLKEYLQVVSAFKSGYIDSDYTADDKEFIKQVLKQKISVERSCGGL